MIVVKTLLALLLLADISGVSLAGVPISMAVLVALLAVILLYRKDALRLPSWLQVAFLSAFCLGLIPLTRAQLSGGVREVAQCLAYFGIAWTLFSSVDHTQRRWLGMVLPAIGALAIAWGVLGRFADLSTPISDARLGLILALSFPFLVDKLLALRQKYYALPAAGILILLASHNGGLLLCTLIAAAVVVIIRARRDAWQVLVVAAVPLAIGMILMGGSTWDTLVPRRADTANLKRLYLEYEALPKAVAAAPLAGHGLGRYKDVIHGYFLHFPERTDNRIVADTNSIYAVVAVNAGLPAALVLIALLGVVAAQAVAAAVRNNEASAEAGAAIALLFAGLFTTILTRNTGIVAACTLGLATAVLPRPTASFRTFRLRLAPFCVVCAICLAAAILGVASRPVVEEDASAPETVKTTGPLIMDGAAVGAVAYWLIEAENPIAKPDGEMRITEANDASGNKVLSIPFGPEYKGKGSAAYKIDTIPAGSYVVWVRAQWTDGCSNSIGCTIGGKHAIITDEVFEERWHWVASAEPFDVPAGPLELRLDNTESGIMIDQILLTPDKRYVPHGIAAPRK